MYDRLAEVLLVILKEKPENPIEKFEALLGRVKDAEMDAAYTKKKPITFRGIPELEQASEGCSLFKPVELSVNKNGQQTTVVDPIDCKIPDLAAECRMLEWAVRHCPVSWSTLRSAAAALSPTLPSVDSSFPAAKPTQSCLFSVRFIRSAFATRERCAFRAWRCVRRSSTACISLCDGLRTTTAR